MSEEMTDNSIQSTPPISESPKTVLSPTKIRNVLIGLALLVIAGGVGYQLGQKQTTVSINSEKKFVINQEVPENREIDFAQFWDVWTRLEQNYVDREALDPEVMVQGAIKGMVASLGDPYTVFLPPTDNQEFKDDLGGTLEGIGAQLGMRNERIVVIAPLKGTPADRAGVRAGDIILTVDDVETLGWSVPEAVTNIRGPKGSTVRLGIFHEGASKEEEISIVRDTIYIPSVELELIEASGSAKIIAHVQLQRFGDQTNRQWDEVAAQISRNPNIDGVVLDLRNNPGGYLQSAIYIASEFIANGIVVQQENFDGTTETFSVVRAGNLLDIPMVVLLNRGSASASEILAGALRDHDRAAILGETSFGKGSVQTPQDLPDGSGLHITTAKWLLPEGEWINSVGIDPEIEIADDIDTVDIDEQLLQAVEEVARQI